MRRCQQRDCRSDGRGPLSLYQLLPFSPLLVSPPPPHLQSICCPVLPGPDPQCTGSCGSGPSGGGGGVRGEGARREGASGEKQGNVLALVVQVHLGGRRGGGSNKGAGENGDTSNRVSWHEQERLLLHPCPNHAGDGDQMCPNPVLLPILPLLSLNPTSSRLLISMTPSCPLSPSPPPPPPHLE